MTGFDNLNLHHFEPYSRSNGPGLRSVVWVQGCSLNCPACFNPQTHPNSGGKVVSVKELARKIINLPNRIEGITISGGEPLQQLAPTIELITSIRKYSSLSIILFSGFSTHEIKQLPNPTSLFQNLDVLLAGRYRSNHHLTNKFLGSHKEIIFFTDRYTENDFTAVPPAEVIISKDGSLAFSGIDPMQG